MLNRGGREERSLFLLYTSTWCLNLLEACLVDAITIKRRLIMIGIRSIQKYSGEVSMEGGEPRNIF